MGSYKSESVHSAGADLTKETIEPVKLDSDKQEHSREEVEESARRVLSNDPEKQQQPCSAFGAGREQNGRPETETESETVSCQKATRTVLPPPPPPPTAVKGDDPLNSRTSPCSNSSGSQGASGLLHACQQNLEHDVRTILAKKVSHSSCTWNRNDGKILVPSLRGRRYKLTDYRDINPAKCFTILESQ